MNIGTISILDGACQITNAAIACILQAHCRIVFRPFFSHDGILETSFLEGSLPVVDTLDKVFSPLLRCGRVDVVNNGLDGFNQFAVPHFLYVFRTWFQTPTGDETFFLNTLLVVGIAGEIVREETYTWVVIAAHHRFLWQEDEANVKSKGCFASSSHGRYLAYVASIEGFNYTHLSICWECLDIFYEADILVLQ